MTDMNITVDKKAMDNQLASLLAREPDLFADVEDLFFSEGAPYEPSGVFDYFFSVVESSAFGTERPAIAIRLRDPNQIRVALRALKGKIGNDIGHG
jgi:hypothetical protein